MAHDEVLTADEAADWQSFMQMQEMLRSRLEQNLVARSNLTAADYTVLAALSEHSPMRQAELGQLLGWEKSRLHHQLTRMHQRGLVERRPAPERGSRAVEIACTTGGREAIAAAAPEHARDVRQWVLDALSADELAQLGAISRLIMDRLVD